MSENDHAANVATSLAEGDFNPAFEQGFAAAMALTGVSTAEVNRLIETARAERERRYRDERRAAAMVHYNRLIKTWRKQVSEHGWAYCNPSEASLLKENDLRMPGHTIYRYSTAGEDLSDLAETMLNCPACGSDDRRVFHTGLEDGFYTCGVCGERFGQTRQVEGRAA